MLALTSAFESAKDKPRRCERLVVSAIEHASVRSGGRFPAAQVDEFVANCRWGGRSFRAGAAAQRAEMAGCAISAGLAHGGQQRDRGDAADPGGRGAWCMPSAGCCMSTRFRSPDVFLSISTRWTSIFYRFLRTSSAAPWASALWCRRTSARRTSPSRTSRAAGRSAAPAPALRTSPGIAGFGVAAAAAMETMAADAERMRALRDRLEAGLKRGPAVIFGEAAERLPNTTPVRGSRPQGGDRPDQPRPRRLRGVFGIGLLVGQGHGLPCAYGDGGCTGTRRRGDPGEHRADHHRKRDRFVPGGLEQGRCRLI